MSDSPPRLAPSGRWPRQSVSVPKAAGIALLAAVVVATAVLLGYRLIARSSLTPTEMDRYLADTSDLARTRRALMQLAASIDQGDPSARQWYPAVLRLASCPDAGLRRLSAWVMSHDAKSAEFHQGLLKLLEDKEPLVRWNAAVALVKFGDPAGRPQMREMLRPYTLISPATGVLQYKRSEHSFVDSGSRIAVIEDDNPVTTISAPLTGLFDQRLAVDGTRVAIGEPIALLAPGQEQVFQALGALATLGCPQDLPDVERYERSAPGLSDSVEKQAKLTAGEIRKRFSESSPEARRVAECK